MISHGFIAGALFLCYVIYDRMHTRDIDAYGGLVNRMPAYAMIFCSSPWQTPSSGFVGNSDACWRVPGQHGSQRWPRPADLVGGMRWLYRRVVLGT
jgi:NADH-quinone oxidoreductase subunit M